MTLRYRYITPTIGFLILFIFGQTKDAYASDDRISKHINLDSVANLSIDYSIKVLYLLILDEDKTFRNEANKFVFNTLHRAMRNDYENKQLLFTALAAYANQNLEYKFVLSLLETTFQEYENMTPREELVLNKYIAFCYNKMGYFRKSMELFSDGIEMAESIGDDIMVFQYYHHLTHEYNFLTLVDSSFVVEQARLSQKCYDYAVKNNDSFAIAFQTLGKQLYGYQTVQEIQESKKLATDILDQLADDVQSHHDNIYELYLLLLFRNGHYKQFLKDANVLLKLKEYQVDPYFMTCMASSYAKTGNFTKARTYVQKAKKNYEESIDRDRQRFAILYLPETFNELGMYPEAFEYSKKRNSFLQEQILSDHDISHEIARFNRELEQEMEETQFQKSLERYLIIGLVFIAIFVVFIVISVRAIRSKNRMIEEATAKLGSTNTALKQANEDLETFARASTIDIKNPLQTIAGHNYLIRSDHNNVLSPDSQVYLNAINQSIQDANNLVSSVLKYAQVSDEKAKLTPTNLNECLERVIQLLHKQINDSKFTINIQPDLPEVLASPDLLRQAMLNIISNAIKYRRKGVPPHLEIFASKNPYHTRIHFQDNGIGIPEENLMKIFDLFGRANNSGNFEGVGIGLAICLKIMKIHGGRIMASNNSDHGTTIILVFPNQ